MKIETFDSKEERNERWNELRKQRSHVVRFSGNRRVILGQDTNIDMRYTRYGTGPVQLRPIYISTFSVAYPER